MIWIREIVNFYQKIVNRGKSLTDKEIESSNLEIKSGN